MNTDNTINVLFDTNGFQYEKIGQEKKWRMASDFTTTITVDKQEAYTYGIQKGFETNFRSGPDWLNFIADKIGEPPIAMSWLIHDVNYEGYLSRSRADKLLFYMLLDAGLGNVASQTIYIGLQIFGSFRYADEKSNPYIIFKHEILPRTRSSISRSIDDAMTFDSQDIEEVKKRLMKMAATENKEISAATIEQYYQ